MKIFNYDSTTKQLTPLSTEGSSSVVTDTNGAVGTAGQSSNTQTLMDYATGGVKTLIGSDSGKSARTIAAEEVAEQLVPENAGESLDTLQEIAAWIQSHPGDAASMNQRITNLETAVPFMLYIQNGTYGYKNSNNEFVAFKSQADIDAAVAAAAAVGTATAADVLAGKTFSNSSAKDIAGSMPDNSTRTSNGEVPGIQSNYPNEPVRNGTALQYNTGTDGVRRFAMAPPKGYYPGSASYVGAQAQTKTCTPSTSQQTISPDRGKVLESVIVKAMPTRFQGGRLSTRKNIDGWSNAWVAKTWNSLTNFYIDGIWTDGANIYYSYGSSNQYVLNKSTSTWTAKTWSGFTNFAGSYVWTDGTDIYYSHGSAQYVLNKSTSTWSAKTWNGLTYFDGYVVWTDGTNIYYSAGSEQYVLNKATSTWSVKTWSGLTRLDGNNVWTDGTDIYYSYGSSTQYVLNKTNSTWTKKTWSGLTSLYGRNIWTDGDNIYHSSGSTQYVLNKTNSTWTAKTWNSLTSFDGGYVWTDGDNIYYSSGSTQYVLAKTKTHWPV